MKNQTCTSAFISLWSLLVWLTQPKWTCPYSSSRVYITAFQPPRETQVSRGILLSPNQPTQHCPGSHKSLTWRFSTLSWRNLLVSYYYCCHQDDYVIIASSLFWKKKKKTSVSQFEAYLARGFWMTDIIHRGVCTTYNCWRWVENEWMLGSCMSS